MNAKLNSAGAQCRIASEEIEFGLKLRSIATEDQLPGISALTKWSALMDSCNLATFW
jgi:hypothetical protein